MNIVSLLANNNYCIFNKDIAKNLSTNAAIILGLLCSKQNMYGQLNQLTNIKGEQYFYCTRDDIYDETGLKEDAQRSAMKLLKDNGILIVKRFGVPSKNYYRIDAGNLLQTLERFSSWENPGLDIGKTQDKSLEKPSQLIITDNNKINKSISKDIEQTPPTPSKLDDIISKVSKNELPDIDSKPKRKQKQINYLEIHDMINRFSSNEEVRNKLKEYYDLRKIKTKGGLLASQFKVILDDLADYSLGDVNIMLSEIKNAIVGNENGCFMTIIPTWNKGKTYKQDEKYNFKGTARTSYGARSNFDNTANHKVPTGIASMTEEEKQNYYNTQLARDENGNFLKF